MVKTAILAIGNELLDGSIQDTNTAFIAKELMRVGITPEYMRIMPDDLKKMVKILRKSLEKYDLIITTGGLGPTFDDLTATAVASACEISAVFNQEAYDHMKDRLKGYNVEIGPGHMHQVTLPENAVLIPNAHGTALGFIVEFEKNKHRCLCVSLPGVPLEMKPMMRDFTIKYILNRFEIKPPFIADLRFYGIPESAVDNVIRANPAPESSVCIINASIGEVILRLRDTDHASGKEYIDKMKSLLGDYLYAEGMQPIEEMVVKALTVNKLTLSVAESCTGGLIGGAITNVAGSSDVFYGGVISYSNEMKIDFLGVGKNIIDNYGAVSSQCGIAMADGIAVKTGSACSISTTGIAGPGGGTMDKPVGTVYITVKLNDNIVWKKFSFNGERDAVRTRAVKTALTELYLLIKKYENGKDS